jgi:hypothetical protein
MQCPAPGRVVKISSRGFAAGLSGFRHSLRFLLAGFVVAVAWPLSSDATRFGMVGITALQLCGTAYISPQNETSLWDFQRLAEWR